MARGQASIRHHVENPVFQTTHDWLGFPVFDGLHDPLSLRHIGLHARRTSPLRPHNSRTSQSMERPVKRRTTSLLPTMVGSSSNRASVCRVASRLAHRRPGPAEPRKRTPCHHRLVVRGRTRCVSSPEGTGSSRILYRTVYGTQHLQQWVRKTDQRENQDVSFQANQAKADTETKKVPDLSRHRWVLMRLRQQPCSVSYVSFVRQRQQDVSFPRSDVFRNTEVPTPPP